MSGCNVFTQLYSCWQFFPLSSWLLPGLGRESGEVQHQEDGSEGGRPRDGDPRPLNPLKEEAPHNLLVLEL